MSTEAFNAVLALIGVVIVLSTLLSGWIERANLPQVGAFLLLGLAIGAHGLGWLDVGLDSPFLRVVGTLGLALVLFTDAVTLDTSEVKRHLKLGALMLGPGTLLTTAALVPPAYYLLGLPWTHATILSAALASTDPVMLRGLLRRRDLPGSLRTGLRLESSLNDLVLLPILLVALVVATGGTTGASPALMAFNLFVLGPGAGALVGLIAIFLLRAARTRIGVRRDYESIYSLGVCFSAFAAAEVMHGSGFLAAFAAGLVIALIDRELCDCFVEYGETTAEMLLLFTFVLLGGGLIWTGLGQLTVGVALFALIALLIRPAVLLVALRRTVENPRARLALAWFGPRGLSSLLLILLPVFAGLPGSDRLFAICGVVVLLSVVVHGGSISVVNLKRPEAPSHLRQTDPLLMTVEDLATLESQGVPVQMVDVRSTTQYTASHEKLVGALRLDPEHAVPAAGQHLADRDAWAALFCT